MTIAFFSATEEDRKFFQKKLGEHKLLFFSVPLTEKIVDKAADADIVSVFVRSDVTADIIKKFPKLKFIATRSTGFDHIDLKAAKDRGIVVSTVPRYGSETVAEFAFALLLAVSRKVADAYYALRQDGHAPITHFGGFDLGGKTLGVIGTGAIGKNVIRIAKGFTMNVIAYDVYPDTKAASTLGFVYRPTLRDLLSESDVVTIHVPYMKETHHLINEQSINWFKPGAVLINTSRGAVIDTDALMKALVDKRIAAAGLDVLEGEHDQEDIHLLLDTDPKEANIYQTLLQNKALIDMDNVVVTPHIAFNSREARMEILQTTAENIERFIAGDPQNIVDK